MKDKLTITGARVHNLKNVSLSLPRNQLIVFTGLSGSGKSSLAFDTIFAEGQRRYMESLSSYARQFLNQMDKPDVDDIDGLSPAISIDQKSTTHNPRSTVGTTTEIYDYLRLLYGAVGVAHCPSCDEPIQAQSPQQIVDQLLKWPENTQITLLAPVISQKKGTHVQTIQDIQSKGFTRIRVNQEIVRIDACPDLKKTKSHSIDIVVDRLTLSADQSSRLFDSIETCIQASSGTLIVLSTDPETDQAKDTLFSTHFACPTCEINIPEISHRLFSFNSPIGACKTCNGLGDTRDFDPELVFESPQEPLKNSTGKIINLNNTIYGRQLNRRAVDFDFDLNTRYCDLTDRQRNVLLYGNPDGDLDKEPPKVIRGRFGRRRASAWEGVIRLLRRRYYETRSDGMRFYFRSYMRYSPCHDCHGNRLKPEALSVKITQQSISNCTALPIRELLAFCDTLKLTDNQKQVCQHILKEITSRLDFLINVGLDYLSLDRKAMTLSGGEMQRIRLATQIGAGLTGVLYVLDEPSIGLHQRDNQRLIETLIKLRDLGNTLIVVEHDEDMIRQADHVVDIGPLAGRNGGEIVYSGNLAKLKSTKNSLTADYLSGTKQISIPKKRRSYSDQPYLTFTGVSENNLKDVTVSFPLGQLICRYK